MATRCPPPKNRCNLPKAPLLHTPRSEDASGNHRARHRASTIISCTVATLYPPDMNRRHYAVTLQQASQDSPMLAKLAALTRDSSERLRAVEALIPPTLRSAVQAGPIENDTWCLLVKNNAAAAKLRQLLPALEAHLRSRGWVVKAIRLKILT